MTETTPRGQDFEASLKDATQTVEQFEDDRKGFVSRLQHFLHSNPSMVPFIVLVLSTIGLGLYIDWEPISVRMGWARLEDVSRFHMGGLNTKSPSTS